MPEQRHDADFFARFGKYPYVKGALALAVVLLLPFYLYSTNARAEPYPAIILPGGASIVERDATTSTFNSIRFYGIDRQSGVEVELDNRRTIRPMSLTRLRAMTRYAFNLDSIPSFGWRKFRHPGSFYKNSEENREGIWKWLGNNLAAQGCRHDTLIIRQVATTIDYSSRERIGEELTKAVHLGKN